MKRLELCGLCLKPFIPFPNQTICCKPCYKENRQLCLIFIRYQRSALAKKLDFALTPLHFKSLWQNTCNYCGEIVQKIGIDRLNNSLGYIVGNVASCCKVCNFMKRTMSVSDFIAHCQRIVNNTILPTELSV